MHHLVAAVVVCAALGATGCAAGLGAGASDEASATPSLDVTLDDLDATSLTVRPFGDFLVSSGDLVWVSGVEPGIVAYDATMAPTFEVEAGTVWAALWDRQPL